MFTCRLAATKNITEFLFPVKKHFQFSYIEIGMVLALFKQRLAALYILITTP